MRSLPYFYKIFLAIIFLMGPLDEILAKPPIPNAIFSIKTKNISYTDTKISIAASLANNNDVSFLTIGDKINCDKFSLSFKNLNQFPSEKELNLSGLINDFSIKKLDKTTLFSFSTKVASAIENFQITPITDNLKRITFDLVAQEKKAILFKDTAKESLLSSIINKKPKIFKVVLDPGHGGIDSGAIAPDGTMEKNIALTFAKKLRDELKKNRNIKVYLTRTKDEYLYLDERVAKARQYGADLFISIHADIIHSKKIRGSTIYTLSSKGSDEIAKKLAQEQNEVDKLGAKANCLKKTTEPVEDILLDLTNAETNKYRSIIANDMMVEMRKQKIRLINNPTRSANFRVLKTVSFPSVLIELGYLSSPLDKNTICSKMWQQRMAKAIASAIEKFRVSRSL